MGKTKRKFTTFINEHLYPLGLKTSLSAMRLEIPRDYLELLYEGDAFSHPSVRCPCGSDKVFNYGIPRNNGRYFICRKCNASFKTAINKHEWKRVYGSTETVNPVYDLWLDNYGQLLEESRGTPILDLGAGYGNDTMHLRSHGFKTISCDYSEEALRRLMALVDGSDLICLDILDGLPFPDNTFKLIIANLSLHYFSWHDTECIIEEIDRVLMKDGYLLCRIKSVNDNQCLANKGTRIEANYFNINGKRNRFFSEKELQKLFRKWDTLLRFEHDIKRFDETKIIWEVAVQKL